MYSCSLVNKVTGTIIQVIKTTHVNSSVLKSTIEICDEKNPSMIIGIAVTNLKINVVNNMRLFSFSSEQYIAINKKE